jgi:colanic acid biosynthesis glycosyl transferase WcaI
LRILFISQLFDPENSIKGLEFARRLSALGHEVEVVTTFPSYPGGKIYAGYRQRWKQVEVIDGITVVRLPTFISYGKSAVKRVLSYASFGVVATIYSLLVAKRPQAIYAYFPPVVVGFVAFIVGTLRRVPFVYDVQDLWPEALVATGIVKQGRITNTIDVLCGFIYRRAARVIVLSDGYKRALIAKNVPASKIERIFNWCDERRMAVQPCDDASQALLDPRLFNVLYAGNLGAAQALEHLIAAAALVAARAGGEHIRFVFVGAGGEKDRLMQLARAKGLKNTLFFPQVPPEQVGAILASADVLVVHLADKEVFEITIPSKTQANLMIGRPSLMAVRGEAARIIEEANAGIVVEPCQPERLAQAALQLASLSKEELRAMGERAQIYYQKNMSMDKGVRSVDGLLRAVTGAQRD